MYMHKVIQKVTSSITGIVTWRFLSPGVEASVRISCFLHVYLRYVHSHRVCVCVCTLVDMSRLGFRL